MSIVLDIAYVFIAVSLFGGLEDKAPKSSTDGIPVGDLMATEWFDIK